jgi:hypothetical protein
VIQPLSNDQSLHIEESKIEGGQSKLDIEHILPGEVAPQQ